MNFEIKPHFGVDALHFGMSVKEVRRALIGNFKSFLKTSNAAFPCDHFIEAAVFAYYKPPGLLEALEFSEPANPLLNGKRLIGVLAGDAKATLEAVDQSLEIDSDVVISHALGIGLYMPGWSDDVAQTVESVIVFEDGYYGSPQMEPS